MKVGNLLLCSLCLALLSLSCAEAGSVKNLENQGLPCPEWKAAWIAAPWDKGPAPEFRAVFRAEKEVRKATVYFCGLGFGELFLDGKKVGTDLLSPNFTNYSYRAGLEKGSDSMDCDHFRGFHTLYLSYDLTGFFHQGDNEIKAVLGNGFYSIDYYDMYPAFGGRKLLCQIDVEYGDGTSASFCSDASWQVRESGILEDHLFNGEVFDARHHGEWQQAVEVAAPETELLPQTSPADKVMETLRPQKIEKLADGSWRVDFGDYVSGWVRLKGFKAPAGTEVEVVHECEVKGNGLWKYISDGEKHDYAPRFTWYVFRTVVVKGWPGKLKSSDIEAQVVYSNMPTVGEFECSNPLLSRIHRIWWRTETDNLHMGFASDCPHREKRPYTGDGEVSCVAVMHTFDAEAFYRKWLGDMRDSQNTETGYVPNVAPWLGGGGGVPWGSAICIIPWEHYIHYGDATILEENFFAMTEYLRFLDSWTLPDGTVHQKMPKFGGTEPSYWFNLGEWCPPYGLVGENMVHTWYAWRCATIAASSAHILGRNDDEVKYRELAKTLYNAFHAKFYDAETGSYGDGSGIVDKTGYGTGGAAGKGDGSNIFALAMGVPEDRLETVLQTVKDEFKANDGHFNTGIFGSSLLGETLCRYDLDEYAYAAMTKTDFPSFGYWVAQGADTTWEQWNGNASRNHPMFGGALTWLYRCLAGLQTDDDEPGYRHVVIRPRPAGDLTWVKYRTATPFGPVGINWRISPAGEFRIALRIPDGVRATLFLPTGQMIENATSGEY